MSLEQKEKYIKDNYYGKWRLSGKNAAVIKRAESIANNTKSNPDKLVGVEGIWGCAKVLKYNAKIQIAIFDLDNIKSEDAFKTMKSIAEKAEEIHIVSSSTFKKIAEIGTSAGIFVLAELPQYSIEEFEKVNPQVIVVLDGLEIPGNIGTILRSCDGTNTDAIIITNRKTRITHPKILRSSQGSCFKIPIVEWEVEDAIAWLTKHEYRIILADTDAKKLYYDEEYKGKIAIVMGSERYGISKGWYNQETCMIKIPMYGDCDSLNVGIAATLILYEIAKKRVGY